MPAASAGRRWPPRPGGRLLDATVNGGGHTGAAARRQRARRPRARHRSRPGSSPPLRGRCAAAVGAGRLDLPTPASPRCARRRRHTDSAGGRHPLRPWPQLVPPRRQRPRLLATCATSRSTCASIPPTTQRERRRDPRQPRRRRIDRAVPRPTARSASPRASPAPSSRGAASTDRHHRTAARRHRAVAAAGVPLARRPRRGAHLPGPAHRRQRRARRRSPTPCPKPSPRSHPAAAWP